MTTPAPSPKANVRFAAATAAWVGVRFSITFDPPGLDEITEMAARFWG